MLLAPDEIHALTEVGFLASARGDVARADAIFMALERLRPAGVFVHVGRAMAYLNAGRCDDAAALLERGLAQVPAQDRAELQAFRGLALQLAGRRSESLRALEQAEGSALAQAMRGTGTMPNEGK